MDRPNNRRIEEIDSLTDQLRERAKGMPGEPAINSLLDESNPEVLKARAIISLDLMPQALEISAAVMGGYCADYIIALQIRLGWYLTMAGFQ